MSEQPITHGGPDRRMQVCKCARCERVAVCTPHNDFYTLGDDRNGLLYCEGCFWALAAQKKETR